MVILQEGLRILEFIARALLHILPYFLLSVIIAAGVSQFNFKGKMVEFMRRKAVYAIVIATLIGAVSPLCSCGVIPTLFAFLQIGVPLAPIMSFWITSPVMSPEAFLITWGNLGLELALARLFATILMGIASGFITLKLFPPKSSSSGLLKLSLAQNNAACGCKAESPPKLLSSNPAVSSKWKKFLNDLKKITLFLGGWLVVAFLLEAIIIFYFPDHLIKGLFGQQNGFSVIWAALIGIPLYVNNISAIPIVSGLIQEGMSKGSALAFLLAGPVTAIPAMIAVFGLVKRKVFLLFLLLGLSLSIILGYLYEFISLLWK
ncbi:MAG: permease [Candidatus Aminicenantes bacterium]|nr:MAG: permease [Candidatus Aminicenantes bacterium]